MIEMFLASVLKWKPRKRISRAMVPLERQVTESAVDKMGLCSGVALMPEGVAAVAEPEVASDYLGGHQRLC
jgi:hypothetical protein